MTPCSSSRSIERRALSDGPAVGSGAHGHGVAGEERRHGLGDAARVPLLERVVRAREHERLGLRQPLTQPLLHLVPPGPNRGALGSEHAEHGLGDPPGVIPREEPLLHGRKLDAEESVGVGDQLLERARNQPIEPASVVWPDRPAKEAVGRALLVAGTVLLQHRPERFGEQGSAWDVDQRRLEQDERVDDLRRVERQLQGDGPAGGMADDVGALDAEMPQQGAAVGGLLDRD